MLCARMFRLLALSFALTALVALRPAAALDYPTKPVRFIICFAAGGPNDIIGRLFGD